MAYNVFSLGTIFLLIVIILISVYFAHKSKTKFCKIERERDFYKIPLGIIIIVFFALFPIIFAMIGTYIEGLIKGIPIHGGNSDIGYYFLFAYITIPIGFVLLIIWLAISTINAISFFQKKKIKDL